jgi:putative ABC transport system permease protein
MLGNYLTSALGNLLRNKLHAAINLCGLALGLATAILIGLYVRDELTFEHFLPGYQDVYRLETVDAGEDNKPEFSSSAPNELAAALRENFPEFTAITRRTGAFYGVRHGTVEATEVFYSVDPDFLRVLGVPLVAGDPATALATPQSILLPRSLALKYFGTTDCVGQTLEIDHTETGRVGAVFDDLPSNTHLALYGPRPMLSSLAPFSQLAREDRQPAPQGSFITNVAIYVRLKPGTSVADVNARLATFMAARYPQDHPELRPRSAFLVPIDAIHLHGRDFGDFSTGDLATVYAVSATGLLVLLVAGINFINLVTARATRRALEVGVRKAAGATRRQLIAQFLGESVAYAFAALFLAIALVELILPRFDLYLYRTIRFPYWRDPLLLMALPGAALAIGLAAGFYPALVLSRFRPAAVLKGIAATPGSGALRQILVVLQYTISIALLIATAVIYRQTEFATDASLRFDKNLILAISLSGIPGKPAAGDASRIVYDPATVEQVRQRLEALPGVAAAAGSYVIPDAVDSWAQSWRLPETRGAMPIVTNRVMQGFGWFALYGIKPVAGRDFGRDHGEDAAPEDPAIEGTAIVNEAALRSFGFASPAAAIGHELDMVLDATGTVQPRRIVGVVPDFPLLSIRKAIPPTVFVIGPDWSNYINVKLTGDRVPETLAAVDRIWKEMVPLRPIWRQFIDARIELLYRDVTRQGRVFGGFALVAVLIACLGLFGLAAFTAERRTKEIGIRKAMGASTADILKLLIWEFVKPVLLANAIAWPLAYLAMRRWLDGFAYRIDLDPLIFCGAGLLVLAIASAVTLFHALQVARARPVLALRYE